MLVVFDIDGTLTRTVDLDTEAFATAFRRTFGADLPSLDWAAYRNATESGVAMEGASIVLGRSPMAEELGAMQDEFLLLLQEAMSGLSPTELEMPGAGELLYRLTDEGHRIALATGCWHRVATMKLQAAGLDTAGLPMATADDALERKTIMSIAATRSGHSPADRHVYVGDGVWDMRASAELGWDFIGVGPAGCRLEEQGTNRLVPHFVDVDGFLALLGSDESRVERLLRG